MKQALDELQEIRTWLKSLSPKEWQEVLDSDPKGARMEAENFEWLQNNP